MRMTRSFLAILALLTSCGAAAEAACVTGASGVHITGGTTVNVSPVYNPFGGPDQIYSFTVQVTNSSAAACSAGLSFTRSSLAARMSSGGNTLDYGIESAGGIPLLQTAGFSIGVTPVALNRIDFTAPANSTTPIQVQLRIPSGQLAAPGSYADTLATIGLYEIALGIPVAVIDERAFTANSAVNAVCELPPPDVSTLNFSGAITNGRPNAGVVHRASFANVKCNAPTRVHLLGDALRPSIALPGTPGFDNFINFHAAASFGSAAVALDTNPDPAIESALSAGYSPGATISGHIDLDVNLTAGNPVLAGSYSATLTIEVDPNL